MPPSVESVIIDQIKETRAEMREGFRELREAVAGYDRARCEQHTERMSKIASRMDTYEAATAALAAHRNTTWSRFALAIGMMGGVSAAVVAIAKLVGWVQ